VNKAIDGRVNSFKKKEGRMADYCDAKGLQLKSIKEVHLLCFQLLRIIRDLSQEEKVEVEEDFNSIMPEQPTEEQEIILQQIIIGGLSTNLARKCPIFDKNGIEIKEVKGAKIKYESQVVNQALTLHPLSGVWKEKPEFVIFTELYQAVSDVSSEEKSYMKGMTKVDDISWVYNLGSEALISTSEPLFDNLKSKHNKKKTKIIRYNLQEDQCEAFV
jgi:hypothetical protein